VWKKKKKKKKKVQGLGEPGGICRGEGVIGQGLLKAFLIRLRILDSGWVVVWDLRAHKEVVVVVVVGGGVCSMCLIMILSSAIHSSLDLLVVPSVLCSVLTVVVSEIPSSLVSPSRQLKVLSSPTGLTTRMRYEIPFAQFFCFSVGIVWDDWGIIG
jgi:hypothetical protein